MDETLAGKSILLVEDDYFAAVELATQLKAAGVNVIGPMPSLDEAVAFLRSGETIEGAVLDINLGGQLVFPLADELERRGIPFIFATGYEPDIIPTRHAGKVLLRKPLEEDVIVATLSHATRPQQVTRETARRNDILNRLPVEELDAILPLLKETYVPRGAIMEQRGQTVVRACFPLDNVISLITISPDGNRVETGLIGKEGLSGFGLFDGDDETPFEMLNQIEGAMLSISVENLKQVIPAMPSLPLLAARFQRALGVQVGYTALANARAGLLQRLARWLVMIEDRIPQNMINLTHEYLSFMLGVRRPSVTDTLHILEGEHLIRSTRGCVEILDRKGLIKTAGSIYGPPEAEYQRLMRLPLAVEPPQADDPEPVSLRKSAS